MVAEEWVTIAVRKRLYERLKAKAEKERRSVSNMVEVLLESKLNDGRIP